MSNIIKNIFSSFSAKPTKKVSIVKFCMICKNAFGEKDNAKNEFCTDCITNDRPADMGHWQKFFSQKRANTLSPEMEKLANNSNLSEMVEEQKFGRVHQEASDRNLADAKYKSLQVTSSLNNIKKEVEDILPKILAEMGIDSRKIDASLLIDAIVPAKIARPIGDSIYARAALRQIVAETLPYFNMDKVIRKESAVKTIGEIVVSNDGIILEDGIKRVSNEYGNRVRKIAVDISDLEVDQDDVPSFPDKSEGDDKSQVHHLDDDEADQLLQEKSRTTAPGSSQDEAENGEGQELMPEGIGLESDGEQDAPNYVDFMETPGASGIVNRVDGQEPDVMARKLEHKPVKKAKFEDANLFRFASQINEGLPVQLIKVAEQQLNVIESYQPLETIVAEYVDGAKVAFKYYATDKGILVISDDFTAHAKNKETFANFLAIDGGFVKLSSVEDKKPMEPKYTEDSMDSPTSVDSDDSMEAQNSMKSQDEKSQDEKSNDDKEEKLVETALYMLNRIEQMFPKYSEQDKTDMAITAALQYLATED
jgi:hypothetical protein